MAIWLTPRTLTGNGGSRSDQSDHPDKAMRNATDARGRAPADHAEMPMATAIACGTQSRPVPTACPLARRTWARTTGMVPIERAANTTHKPIATAHPAPPARAMAAAVEAIPTAPQISGVSRRLRLRISNHISTATQGTAAASGSHHDPPARRATPAKRAPNTANSATATPCATAVRAKRRCRRWSTRASLSGVRARNPTSATAPRRMPAALGETNKPRSTGSAVKPQPPCSVGKATALIIERGAAAPASPADAIELTLANLTHISRAP